MKIRNVTITKDGLARDYKNYLYEGVDYKDIEGLLELIDELLKPFNLELYIGNAEDDNIWVNIH